MKVSIKLIGLLTLGLMISFLSRPAFADDVANHGVEAHHQKAKELILNKDFEGARLEILGAIDLKDDTAEYWRILGAADEELNAHHLENLIAWRRYLKLAPDSPKEETILKKISDLDDQIDADKKAGIPEDILTAAIEKYNQPVFMDTDEINSRTEKKLKKAKELISNNDFEGARAEILDAIELKDNVAEYWNTLGETDESLNGHFVENRIAWSRFLKLAPNNPEEESILDKIADLDNKIETLNKSGLPKEILSPAVEKYDLTAFTDTDVNRRAKIHYQKAKDLVLNKDYEDARAEILGAIELKDDEADDWRILGGVDELLDAHYKENLRAWNVYLKLAPDSSKRESILDKIAVLYNKIEADKKAGKPEETLNPALTRFHQSGKFIVQIQGGPDFPISSGFASNFNMGEGAECLIGYGVNDNITLGLLSGYHSYNYQYNYPGFTYSVGVMPIEAVGQFYMGIDRIKPYLLLGAGACSDTYSITSAHSSAITYTDLLIDPGIGLAVAVSENFNFFIQAKLTMDFTSNGFFQENLALYLPVQMGCDLLF